MPERHGPQRIIGRLLANDYRLSLGGWATHLFKSSAASENLVKTVSCSSDHGKNQALMIFAFRRSNSSSLMVPFAFKSESRESSSTGL